MSTNQGFSLARYAPWRRWVEVGGPVLLYLANATANSITSGMDIRRAGLDWAAWGPWVWEFSSNLVLLALIPAVLWFEARFPLQRDTWRRSWRWHLLASVAYSLVHVVAMLQLRDGGQAPCSRRYRSVLRERVGGEAANESEAA